MYRCSICQDVSKPGEALIRHIIYKATDHKQINRELPVCKVCAMQLRIGRTPAQIKQSLTVEVPQRDEPPVRLQEARQPVRQPVSL